MKTDIYKKILIGTLSWFFLGICLSFDKYKQIWNLSQFNKLKSEKRNEYFYGSDYLVYKFLGDTPFNTKILYLIPDGYYFAKAIFFLYPREIKFLTLPSDLSEISLSDYDYLLIYFSIEDYQGLIGGLNLIQRTSWKIDDFVEIDRKLNKIEQITKEKLTNKIVANKGILLYKLD